MVSNITSLTGHGLRDWLFQRVSAVVLALYAVFFIIFLLANPGLEYSQWQALFANTWMKVATVLTLLALIIHAWIGLWTVSTDYIKLTMLRLPVQIFVFIGLLGFFIWGIQIVWSV